MAKTMPWLPPIFLGMVTIPPIYKNGDDWGMVQMTFFYINGGFLWTSPKTKKNTKSLDLSIRKKTTTSGSFQHGWEILM